MRDLARSIIDANAYMTLATADEAGTPWASPVSFAHAEHREFYWLSSPTRRHSLNIDARPDVSLVVFDSTVALNTGQAVYVSATAGLVEDVEGPIALFSERSEAYGGRPWTSADVTSNAPLRLYRATATELWVVDGATRGDHRTRVLL